ncbi:hypothetical protein PWT90_07965 [Aphanocladium album]|nr:hypothetical protein PWT90_07965 [Aphanocladium album]
MSDSQMLSSRPPDDYIFGPHANCTLETCDIEWSTYKYRPSLPANIVMLILFTTAWNIHVFLGIRWKTVWFMNFMMIGCGSEIIGYIGRILMWKNPFGFPGFMLQVIFITGGPVFFSAAIYITLSVTIEQLAPQLSRLRPVIFYWIFITADIICIVLQASGGALSTVSYGASETGVKLALAGLAAQVIFLFAFSICFFDYMIRYYKSNSTPPMTSKLRTCFCFLALAFVCIFGRCCYRCYELSQGYKNSTVITNESLFIGLEGALILVAVFALIVAHPGRMFREAKEPAEPTSELESPSAEK